MSSDKIVLRPKIVINNKETPVPAPVEVSKPVETPEQQAVPQKISLSFKPKETIRQESVVEKIEEKTTQPILQAGESKPKKKKNGLKSHIKKYFTKPLAELIENHGMHNGALVADPDALIVIEEILNSILEKRKATIAEILEGFARAGCDQEQEADVEADIDEDEDVDEDADEDADEIKSSRRTKSKIIDIDADEDEEEPEDDIDEDDYDDYNLEEERECDSYRYDEDESMDG